MKNALLIILRFFYTTKMSDTFKLRDLLLQSILKLALQNIFTQSRCKTQVFRGTKRCESNTNKKCIQQKKNWWYGYKTIYYNFLMKILWWISANWCLKKYCLWTWFLSKGSKFDKTVIPNQPFEKQAVDRVMFPQLPFS